jgi:hypothetical protein
MRASVSRAAAATPTPDAQPFGELRDAPRARVRQSLAIAIPPDLLEQLHAYPIPSAAFRSSSMSVERSAFDRTEVGPVQASTVGPVQMSAPSRPTTSCSRPRSAARSTRSTPAPAARSGKPSCPRASTPASQSRATPCSRRRRRRSAAAQRRGCVRALEYGMAPHGRGEGWGRAPVDGADRRRVGARGRSVSDAAYAGMSLPGSGSV